MTIKENQTFRLKPSPNGDETLKPRVAYGVWGKKCKDTSTKDYYILYNSLTERDTERNTALAMIGGIGLNSITKSDQDCIKVDTKKVTLRFMFVKSKRRNIDRDSVIDFLNITDVIKNVLSKEEAKCQKK